MALQFRSDDFVAADDGYVDIIRVSELVSIFDVDAEAQTEAMEQSIGALFPNPTAGGLAVYFVTVQADSKLLAGAHRLTWNGRSAHGRSLSAGTYVLRLAADGSVLTRRFVRIGG